MERICLLDLDGTLIDSAADIRDALNRLMARRGLPGFAMPEVHRMIGDGVAVLVRRALEARGQAFDPAALAKFVPDYEAHANEQTAPFAGVPEVLAELRREGWRLAVCTNKPVAAARLILEHLGLAPLVDALAGGDSFPVRKPDPGHLLGTLRLMGVTAEGSAPPGVVMVGDHANDIRSARGAGVAPVFAAWGYGLPEMADGAPVAASPADLPALLARIGGRD